MKPNILCYVIGIAIFALTACGDTKTDKKEESVKQLVPERPAEVTTMVLETTDFEHELVSNGKISARNIAELKFHTSEVISAIYVKNGDRVEKGQRIAMLDTYSLTNAVNQAENALERSKLEYQDVLIGQGFMLDRPEDVPDEVNSLAKVKSGLNSAQIQYEIAVYNLEKATMTAPISGIIANLFTKSNTMSTSSSVFCNIIDTRSLEATFTVLENELGMIKTGDKVVVTPFSMIDEVIQGRVSEINPWVDKNGMVQVKATVDYHQQLVEGMNVRVSVFRSLGKQWVVPKSAVVLRTGRQIVFTLENGKAMWNDVNTGLENASFYTITSEKIKEGDHIITSGNINLAHESPVTVIDELEQRKDD